MDGERSGLASAALSQLDLGEELSGDVLVDHRRGAAELAGEEGVLLHPFHGLRHGLAAMRAGERYLVDHRAPRIPLIRRRPGRAASAVHGNRRLRFTVAATPFCR